MMRLNYLFSSKNWPIFLSFVNQNNRPNTILMDITYYVVTVVIKYITVYINNQKTLEKDIFKHLFLYQFLFYILFPP
ncbi:hypothetical protein AYI68_g706 [Smittium mucronatum]|uniref:Uncharacterized protein n=1 Tax=Smittium mucronatum TaxID=133383 RepID=A0A1R0H7F6_9FUNG|nr:hypothetical protein AYI68_g706 [Smittium mucronatum]